MRKEWLHKELVIPAEGYRLNISNKQDSDADQGSSRLPYLLALLALVGILLLVPLLMIKLASAPKPKIVKLMLPALQEQMLPQASTNELFSKLSTSERALFRAQTTFIASLIKNAASSHTSPKRLAYLITSESYKANYDPLFVTAVVLAESSFKAHAKSPVGARGLMQIMPATGKYISESHGIHWKGTEKLYNESYNLELGIAYLQDLKKTFRGDIHRTLVAYNWGPGNVLKRKRQPPASSLQYSRKIRTTYNKWRRSFRKYTNPAALPARG